MVEFIPINTPISYYGMSSIVYFVSSFIALLVCLFAFRLYRITSSKSHLTLSLGFGILSFALISLMITSVLIYQYNPTTPNYDLSQITTLGFRFYYALSLLAYIIFASLYLLPKKGKFLPVIFLPLWYAGGITFHLISLVILAYIVFRNVLNTFKKKNLNSFFVLLAFTFISLYHILVLVIPSELTFYLVAHSFLALGFASLLLMLIRVSRK
jgi:hypothetical protein